MKNKIAQLILEEIVNKIERCRALLKLQQELSDERREACPLGGHHINDERIAEVIADYATDCWAIDRLINDYYKYAPDTGVMEELEVKFFNHFKYNNERFF